MKKEIFCIAIASTLLLSGCSSAPAQKNINKPDLNDIHSSLATNEQPENYIFKNYKGNYIWGGAMNLAWNELSENVIHEKIKLNTTDEVALETVNSLNNASFSKNDLDEESYYIKSGYGQSTVNTINKESRQKFPDKSFDDLDIQLSDRDIISYAYFLKKVEYITQFSESDVTFNTDTVKGFKANNEQERDNVSIVKYWDDDRFIIGLKLKDNKDQLFLVKGLNDTNPDDLVKLINSNTSSTMQMRDSDKFSMPKLHVDMTYTYSEMINKSLANENFKDYVISEMYENIKFDMDHKGAKVENEAVIVTRFTSSLNSEEYTPKNLLLDKPFMVIMKRSDSNNPYFVLNINNSDIMEK